MSGRVRFGLFGVGVLLFSVLVRQVGLAALVTNAASVGWMFVPVMLLYGVSLLCSAYVWHLTLAGEPSRPPFSAPVEPHRFGCRAQFRDAVHQRGR